MNFFSFLGKSEKSEHSPTNLDQKHLFTETTKSYSKKLKRLFSIDSTRETLTDNELLAYVQYDIKLHDLLYKSS